jgi:hypothetical protein
MGWVCGDLWFLAQLFVSPDHQGRSIGNELLKRTFKMGEHWTKLSMISTLDDIWWIWSKRASSTSIVASLYGLAAVPFHLVQ